MRKFILLVISLVLLSGCGKNVIHDEVKKEEVITDEIKNSLLDRINDLDYLDFYNKSVMTRDLSNQEVLRLSYEIFKTKNGDVSFSFEDLESIAKDYFDFPLAKENIQCDTHFNIQDEGISDYFIIDLETGKYYKNKDHISHPLYGVKTKVYNNYVSSSVDNGIYEVVVNKLFSSFIGDKNVRYYYSYNDVKGNINSILTNDFSKVDKNMLHSYKYSFIKKDGSYKLISYDIK